jgi:hypothetical protein
MLDSAAGIKTSYSLFDRGFRVRFPVLSRTFISQYLPDRLYGPPTSYPRGKEALSPVVKRSGREAGQLPPSSTVTVLFTSLLCAPLFGRHFLTVRLSVTVTLYSYL